MAARLTPDMYMRQVIQRYVPTLQDRLRAMQAYHALSKVLRQWGNRYLIAVRPSGSFAKGTAIRGGTDLDIFLSLRHNTPGSLEDLYYHLNDFLQGTGILTELRNVSIRVSFSGLAVDIVPGRRQHPVPLGGPHSLFSRKSGNWLLTNVDSHVQKIKQSNRKNEIRLTKIWRHVQGLDFPSFYLELSVIDALKGRLPFPLSRNMTEVLLFLAKDFETHRIVDPVNTNNVVSDELSKTEKQTIGLAAGKSLNAAYWSQIVW